MVASSDYSWDMCKHKKPKQLTYLEGLIQILYPRRYSNYFPNATFDIFHKVDIAITLMLQYAFGG